MTVECTDEWNKTYKHIKGEVKNLAFPERSNKIPIYADQKTKRGKSNSNIRNFKRAKNWKNKMVLWCLCRSLENINKRTYFLKKKKTRLRETKRRRQTAYSCHNEGSSGQEEASGGFLTCWGWSVSWLAL